jgi:membrane-associated phospholipid phosphatase
MARVLDDRTRRGIATTLAVLSALALLALVRVFLQSERGQVVDNLGRDTAVAGTAADYSQDFLTVVSTGFVAACLAGLLLVAVLQRHWQSALGAVVVVGGANLTTQLLKDVLTRPDYGVDVGAGNSLPSGHTTVAASLGAAALLVTPHRWRPLVALLAAGYTAATGVATLLGGWHRPSDVLAAVTVVAVWSLAVSAALPLRSPVAAEHGLEQPPPADPAGWRRGWAEVAATRLLAVGTALGAVVAVGGLVLVLAGWVGPGTPSVVRYVGPAGASFAAACALAWATLLLAPRTDKVVHTY